MFSVSSALCCCDLDFHLGPPKLVYKILQFGGVYHIVQELCESRGGRPGLSVLTSLLVSVDVKQY